MSNYLPTVFGENLVDDFDDFDRNFFRGFGNIDHTLYGKHAQNLMKTDVKETEDGYEVDVDLPGFKKDEISLELNNGYLTISTEKSLEKDKENKKGKMLRQERQLHLGHLLLQRRCLISGSGLCGCDLLIHDVLDRRNIPEVFADAPQRHIAFLPAVQGNHVQLFPCHSHSPFRFLCSKISASCSSAAAIRSSASASRPIDAAFAFCRTAPARWNASAISA